MNTEYNNLHENHRKRLKERFLEEGLENFQNHNILELLLFYSVPRRDTNALAHELIDKFGSLSAVFDADYDSLLDCKGVSENTAVLLKLIPKLARAYLMDKDTRYAGFGDYGKAGKLSCELFCRRDKRKAACTLFQQPVMELTDLCVISTGSVIASDISVRKIAETGFAKKAAALYLRTTILTGIPFPRKMTLRLQTNTVRCLQSWECRL